MPDKKTLQNERVETLKKMAKRKKIKGYYKMRKEELVEALAEVDSSDFTVQELFEIKKRLSSEPKIFELRKMCKELGLSIQRNMKKVELKERIQRALGKHEVSKNISSTVTQPVNNIAFTEVSTDKSINIPLSYGKDALAALQINPFWLYFYWDFSNQTANLIETLGNKGKDLILRVYDVTFIIFNSRNANKVWEFPIGKISDKSFYVNVNSPNASYLGEIGYFDDENEFVPVLRSNLVHTQPNNFSFKNEEKWIDLQKGTQYFEESQDIRNPENSLKRKSFSSLDLEAFKEHKFQVMSGGGSFFPLPPKNNEK